MQRKTCLVSTSKEDKVSTSYQRYLLSGQIKVLYAWEGENEEYLLSGQSCVLHAWEGTERGVLTIRTVLCTACMGGDRMRSTYYQDSLVYCMHGRRQNEEHVLTIRTVLCTNHIRTYILSKVHSIRIQ